MEKKPIDFGAMPATAIKVITRPALFYREMPKTGGLVEPLAFMLVMAAVTAVVDALLGLIGVKFILSMGMAIARIVLYPFVILIAGFIWALIMQVVWKAMGSQEPFETSFRCIAYVSALMPVLTIIAAIPQAGPFLSIVAWVYFYVMASVETHGIKVQKAWTVFGILGAVMYLIIVSSGISDYSYRQRLEMQNVEMQKEMQDMQKKLEQMQKQQQK
jgi:hypothetical protein